MSKKNRPKRRIPKRHTFSVQSQLEGKLGPDGLATLVEELGGREDSRPQRKPQR